MGVLSYVSSSLCFKDWTANYHLEVIDKAARKVNVQVHVTKDTVEVLQIDVNNVQVPTITTICNFSMKKFIVKITPTLISFELMDGKVSLLKFLNQFTMEFGANSYLMKGTANLSLNENFFIYKVLSYVSSSLCFKDITNTYHLEVLTRQQKSNILVLTTKDTLEIFHAEVNNVNVSTITTICNFNSMKFIAKITPTMINIEMLDGKVSLIHYLNQLTIEVGNNSYLVERDN
eukprot:TRINITY_DN14587_c0_g1_i1.p1 TRINITY_DN14587_c0_g1~~TRINITY_DN14587_c0_g1_i1.p1  ORF type:complete len:240 (-),score=56.28 TRINITY_DN14587_c0_g1_i1:209-904(-)